MYRFLKLDPEQKCIAAVAGIAISIPALLVVGYAVSSLIRAIF